MSSHKKRKALDKKRRRQRRFQESLGSMDVPPDTLLIRDPPGMAKMSEVLEDFVEPELQGAQSMDDMRNMLSMAAIAWNTALLPAAEREGFLNDAEAKFPADGREMIRALLDGLIQRKLDYFADNTRGIINFDLRIGPDGKPFLNVMSTMPGEM